MRRVEIINNRNKIGTILLSLGLLILVTGISYSFFIYSKTGLYTHTINVGKMKVIYDETTGNNITIENAYPLTDEEALTKSLEFEFTITGYNESDKNIYYAIEIDHGEDVNGKNRFLDSDMKLSLYENDEVAFENEIFENLDNQDIYYGYISYGTSSQIPTVNSYKMNIWINGHVYISDTVENDISFWNDEDFEWAENILEYDELERIDNGEVEYLSELGISVYTSDEFSNSYANFKVNVRADLTYDDIGYLTYDANGGEYTPKKTNLSTGRITTQKPVMEGKGFLGWSTTKDGDVEYYSGDTYTDGEKVLYAVYGETRNVMESIPDTLKDLGRNKNIKNIYFINEKQNIIDVRYEEAEFKADLTVDNQGNVKGWLEQTNSDSWGNYYDLYIASEGTTYLSEGNGLFEYNESFSLDLIDLNNVDTSMVTDMQYMFAYQFGLQELNVSSFNTSKVTNMSYMFDGCSNIQELDVSSFDTSNVIDMSYMFYECCSLIELDLCNFNTSKVTNMSYMFGFLDDYSYPCLTKINLSSFDTSNVIDMSHMFEENGELIELDLTNFDTRKVENMSYMFAGTSLITIYCNNDWNLNLDIESIHMFGWSTKLIGAISFDVNKTDINYANPTTGYFTRKNNV